MLTDNSSTIRDTYLANTAQLKNLIPIDVAYEAQCLACMKYLSLNTNEHTKQYREDHLLLTVLAHIKHRWSNEDVEAQIFSDASRFLRNVTAYCTKAQDDIIELSAIIDAVISRLTTLTTGLHQSVYHEKTERDLVQTRCGIQFLGNLVTGHNQAKKAVFPKVLSLFKFWLGSSDLPIRRYATMFLYNCLLGMEYNRDELLNHPDAFQFVDLIMRCTVDDESEWGLYMLIEFNSSPTFLGRFYHMMHETQRHVLIDFLADQFLTTEGNPCLHGIVFLVKQFQMNADCVFALSGTDSEKDSKIESVQMLKILAILAKASSLERYQREIQTTAGLLCTALCLLRGIHLAGKSGDPTFAPMVKAGLGSTPKVTEDPVHGMKCDLIRLIANMCWKDKTNQDKVREFDGIPLLMDCCKLDNRNPSVNKDIMQWVIYAIRNLTEDNAENQKIISQLERVPNEPSVLIPGMTSSTDDIQRQGVEHEDVDGENDTGMTRQAQTLADFRELFE